MATDVCVTSEVRLAVVVLSVDADGCLYRRWCVTSDGVSPHGVAPRGVAPRGVSRAATPRTAARSSEELDLPGSSRLGALQLGLTPPPLCSGHAQRTRFGPGSGSGKTDVVKRRFLPAKSFIRVGVTSRGHRFQPRIPPQAPYALTTTTFTADRQQTCLQHCPFSLPALSGCQQRVPGLPPGAMSGWLLLY